MGGSRRRPDAVPGPQARHRPRLKGDLLGPGAKIISGIYQTWWDSDATLVEINPLCVVAGQDGKLSLLAVDAKVSLDDNALYRIRTSRPCATWPRRRR